MRYREFLAFREHANDLPKLCKLSAEARKTYGGEHRCIRSRMKPFRYAVISSMVPASRYQGFDETPYVVQATVLCKTKQRNFQGTTPISIHVYLRPACQNPHTHFFTTFIGKAVSSVGAVDAGTWQERRSREAESGITPCRIAQRAQGAGYRLERRSKEAEYRLERRSRVPMSGVPPRLF